METRNSIRMSTGVPGLDNILLGGLPANRLYTGFDKQLFSSGNLQLDTLTGGGLHAGTGTLSMGPAGSGKSTVASMFASTAAKAGHKVLYFAFDESTHILTNRAREIGLDFDRHMESGMLRVLQVDPAEIAPGELANQIVEAVGKEGVKVVILDSLNGYVNAMPQEDYLHLHLHELLSYLDQQGVLTIMVPAQHGPGGRHGIARGRELEGVMTGVPKFLGGEYNPP